MDEASLTPVPPPLPGTWGLPTGSPYAGRSVIVTDPPGDLNPGRSRPHFMKQDKTIPYQSSNLCRVLFMWQDTTTKVKMYQLQPVNGNRSCIEQSRVFHRTEADLHVPKFLIGSRCRLNTVHTTLPIGREPDLRLKVIGINFVQGQIFYRVHVRWREQSREAWRIPTEDEGFDGAGPMSGPYWVPFSALGVEGARMTRFVYADTELMPEPDFGQF